LTPPKGANNQWWAEHAYVEITKVLPDLPVKIVRPEQNASEIGHQQARLPGETLPPSTSTTTSADLDVLRKQVAGMTEEELREAVMKIRKRQADTNSYLRGQKHAKRI